MILETGEPDFIGLYVAQIWHEIRATSLHGYRILQWSGERWEHPGSSNFSWPGNNELVKGWFGPLPKLPPPPLVRITPEPWVPVDEMGDPVKAVYQKPWDSPMEYDL